MKTVFGFTGTRHGMTPAQYLELERILKARGERGTPWELHHGGCVGADAQAHVLAQLYGAVVHRHPNQRPGKQAKLHLRPGVDVDHEPHEDLRRNRNIVYEGQHGLIATPRTGHEEMRSGTWMTVRWARKQGRRIWVIMPEGQLQVE